LGHDGAMAETGNGFLAFRHNMAEANRFFQGSSWWPLLAWRVAVAQRLWQKIRTQKQNV